MARIKAVAYALVILVMVLNTDIARSASLNKVILGAVTDHVKVVISQGQII